MEKEKIKLEVVVKNVSRSSVTVNMKSVLFSTLYTAKLVNLIEKEEEEGICIERNSI